MTQCAKCLDSGWRPNRDADGNRLWTPLMNDAIPCECGALRRIYAAQKATHKFCNCVRDGMPTKEQAAACLLSCPKHP
jgi:hypothetical protein